MKLTIIIIVIISIVLVVLEITVFRNSSMRPFISNESLSVAFHLLLTGIGVDLLLASRSILKSIGSRITYIQSSSNKLFLPFFRKRLLTAKSYTQTEKQDKRETTLQPYQCIQGQKHTVQQLLQLLLLLLLPLHSDSLGTFNVNIPLLHYY